MLSNIRLLLQKLTEVKSESISDGKTLIAKERLEASSNGGYKSDWQPNGAYIEDVTA